MSEKRSKFNHSRKLSKDFSNRNGTNSSITSSLSSDEDTDAQNLKPIKDYMLNCKELSSQLFKSVKSEKIRMMLPQALKKIDFKDLKEWCVNELSGMSKKRIMCIINGQEMEQSSDTDESNSTGISLEIISDTEELLTDNEVILKEESTITKKKKMEDTILNITKDTPKVKSKLKLKKEGTSIQKIVFESPKIESKEKEESLLDLLELEMRARAIRALIRKEEIGIPKATLNGFTKIDKLSSNLSGNKRLNERRENLRKQLDKIDVLIMNGEDEDVLVVDNEAPTIELLSTDSETEEQGDHMNYRRGDVRTASQTSNPLIYEKLLGINSSETILNRKNSKSAATVSNNKSIPFISTDKIPEINSNAQIVEKLETSEFSGNKGHVHEDNKLFKNKIDPVRNFYGKSKTQLHQHHDCTNNEHFKSKLMCDVVSEIKSEFVTSLREKSAEIRASIEDINRKTYKSPPISDEKFLELDVIIDLDDYPDDYDMYEIESKSPITSTIQRMSDSNSHFVSSHSETWASRYYATADVKKVIKESKIQSDIRKRLRERQRMGKLNNFPNSPQPILQDKRNCEENPNLLIPTGSVEEYLALKGSGQLTANNKSNFKEKRSSDCETLDTLNVSKLGSSNNFGKDSSEEENEKDKG